MSIVIDQVSDPLQHSKIKLEGVLPTEAWRMLENSLDSDLAEEPVVMETRYAIDSMNLPPGPINFIVNKQRLNDIRYVNKFLESVNEQLPVGGYFVGCVQTLQQGKDRLYARYPRPLNTLIYCFYFLYKRLWPKLPYLRRAYFALTDGQNRVMSEMESYGRLYSCGFQLLDSVEIEDKLYFVAEKTGKPDYNTEATYGPFIILRRVGKNGKALKVYKLRTMAPYSEYVQEFIYERNGLSGLANGSKFVDDPRITTLGRFCRRYWIDELPMLYNLLRGDLKIFGVRPISKHYFSLYPEDFQKYRSKFKPGLVPPVYVELPKSLEDTVEIERRYLQKYEKAPFRTDISYLFKALYNIFIKRVRSC